MTYAQHPLSAAFPAMSAEDYQALKDSIEAIGVQNAITIFEDMVVDGWHRYCAANELGMPCPEVHLPEDTDPRDFVKAQNKARRHLTAGQWALIEVRLWDWHPRGHPIAKCATVAHLGSAKSATVADLGDAKCATVAHLASEAPEPQKTATEIAQSAGVSTRLVVYAKKVEQDGVPEVKAAAMAAAIPVHRAAEIAALPVDQQKAALEQPAPKVKAKAPKPGSNKALASSAMKALAAAEETIERLRGGKDSASSAPGEPATPDTEVEALRKQIADLKDRIAEIGANLEDVQADNESMARVFEADDRVTQALAEAKRYREQVRKLEARIRSLTDEKQEVVQSAKSWQRKAQKAQA